jgi:hypothetical protein
VSGFDPATRAGVDSAVPASSGADPDVETASDRSLPAQSEAATAIARLGEVASSLADQPIEEHAETYQRIHADLQAALAEIDHA